HPGRLPQAAERLLLPQEVDPPRDRRERGQRIVDRQPLAAALRRPGREAVDQPRRRRMSEMDDRAAGALLHPTSLPGRHGIGDMGDELLVFLDWLQDAGMTIWQVLPLNPPGYGNSPYGCLSSYAGNPLLISPDRLGLEDVG